MTGMRIKGYHFTAIYIHVNVCDKQTPLSPSKMNFVNARDILLISVYLCCESKRPHLAAVRPRTLLLLHLFVLQLQLLYCSTGIVCPRHLMTPSSMWDPAEEVAFVLLKREPPSETCLLSIDDASHNVDTKDVLWSEYRPPHRTSISSTISTSTRQL